MVTCEECGLAVGKGTNISGYKHLVSCFNLPNHGLERLSAEIDSIEVGAGYKERVKIMLAKLLRDE